MYNKIKTFLNEYYNINEDLIKAESELVSELGLTSFQLVEMCAQLEEEFEIDIDEDELTNIITVDDMATLLDKTIKKKSAKTGILC